MKFAIVDIETTWLYHQGHGITEIAIVHADENGRNRKLAFHSMVNPGRSIPAQVKNLTGIDESLTLEAPYFSEIAPALLDKLLNRVFVAHNVNFDYQFLKAAFKQEGLSFRSKRLCTMRLARKLMSELRSHRLASVNAALNIENTARHRAGGDAFAAAEVLAHLVERDPGGVLSNHLKQNNRHAILPPGLSESQVEELPNTSGVYYFYGNKHRPIYIGKAKNLKRRVLSHFTSSGASRLKQLFQREVKRMEFVVTASEYEALLLEDAEIKKHWPRYNRAQKERLSLFAVIPYYNRGGEQRFGILKTTDRTDALAWFNSYHAAKNWLYRELIDYGINPERAGLFRSEGFEVKPEKQEIKAIGELIKQSRIHLNQSFLLFTPLGDKEHTCVAILNGKYRGFGKVENKAMLDRKMIAHTIREAPDSIVARAVVRRMLNDTTIEKYAI